MYKRIGVLIATPARVSVCATPSDREYQVASSQYQIGDNLLGSNDLGLNHSGYLNKDEARGRDGLAKNWRDWDKNEDGLWNRVECTRFEEDDLEARAMAVKRATNGADDRVDRANRANRTTGGRDETASTELVCASH